MVRTWTAGAVLFLVFAAMLGCGSEPPAEAQEDAPTPVPTVVPTPAPTPTPMVVYVEVTAVPPPTPTPKVVYIEVTPVPTPTLAVTPTPVPTSIATPTPDPTPTPSPTPRFRTVDRPQDAGHSGFRFDSGPTLNGHTLSFKAVVQGDEKLPPTQLQVWQALRDGDLDRECSTLRPVAFVGEGQGGGVTPYQWSFCSSSSSKPQVYVDDVPWLTAAAWNVLRRSSNPFVYEWTVTVDLDDQRARELMYDRAAGFVLVGFAGETLLTRRWVK